MLFMSAGDLNLGLYTSSVNTLVQGDVFSVSYDATLMLLFFMCFNLLSISYVYSIYFVHLYSSLPSPQFLPESLITHFSSFITSFIFFIIH